MLFNQLIIFKKKKPLIFSDMKRNVEELKFIKV